MAVLLLVASIGATASGASAADLDAEARFVAALNDIRAAEGLPPLVLDDELTIAARAWTDEMVANADGGAGRGALAHAADLSVGITVYWMKLGENVGYGPDVDVLVDAFVDSPSHYRNIVDPEFEQVGVGVSYDADGTMWTTHRFMISDEDPVVADDPAPEILALDDTGTAEDPTTGTTAPTTDAGGDVTRVAVDEPTDALGSDDVDLDEVTADDDDPTVRLVADLFGGVGDELAGLGL